MINKNDFTPDEKKLIQNDSQRLIRHNLSSKSIKRLYEQTIEYGSTPWGLSSTQTPATFKQTCALAYADALKREKINQQRKKIKKNSFLAALMKSRHKDFQNF